MAQSLSNVLLHIVFSTKDRRPWLQDADLRGELHGYLVGMLRNRECESLAINSVADHIHILCRLSRKMTVSDLLRDIKASSSGWLKDQSPSLTDFQWQGGYAAFSVSRSQVEAVRKYIANQEDHHRRISFQDKLRELLRKHEIAFDERYLWT